MSYRPVVRPVQGCLHMHAELLNVRPCNYEAGVISEAANVDRVVII